LVSTISEKALGNGKLFILPWIFLVIQIVGDWESCDPRVCWHSQMQVAFIPPWSPLLSNLSSLQGVCMLFTCLHQGGGISPPLCRIDGMEVLFLVFPMNTFAVVTDPIMRELFRECGLMAFLDQ
jgi:hypothetical protein